MLRWLRRGSWTVLLILAGGVLAAPGATPDPRPHGRLIGELMLDGPIGPASAEYFDQAAARAVDDGAVAIVLRLDTPGGLSESMRSIVAGILASPVPVLVYVAPAGARAASAGTYILYAGHVAAMAPATHLGAATPVRLGGDTPLPGGAPATARSSAAPDADDRDAEAVKTTNDAVAYIRSLAQLRGRNADWAEQAVRGAATLTAEEALRRHVIDFVADDVPALLAKAEGRTVRVGNRQAVLRLRGLPVREYPPGARARFLAVVTHPTIAYLLLMAGIYGLVLEALHPGTLFPGVLGGICLLAGLYALQLLPVNYAGLALMALGLGLLAAELVSPSVGALGVGGLAAFVLGSVMLMDRSVPGFGVDLGIIAGIAAGGVLLLGLIVRLALRARHARGVTGDASMLGERGVLLEPVDAIGESWAMVRGERWHVRCPAPLPAGTAVRVTERQGLTLRVEPA